MKTKNNVQKTILKSFAVLISFVLLSYTLNAQGLWKQLLEDTSATFAMAVNNSPAPESVSESILVSANNSTIDKDAEMELESWMTDADYFEANSLLEAETEKPLELENWMTTEIFGAFLNETDESLEVENWMLDDTNFKIETQNNSDKKVYRTKSFVYREIEDHELKFEAWMFDNNHFKIR